MKLEKNCLKKLLKTSSIAILLSLSVSSVAYADSNKLSTKEYKTYLKRLVKTGLYQNKDGQLTGSLNLEGDIKGRVLELTQSGDLIVLAPKLVKGKPEDSIYIKYKYDKSLVDQFLERQEALHGK